LGIEHNSVQSAIRLGALQAERIYPRLNTVTAEAIEEYRRNALGRHGRPPGREPKGENASQ
jgi:hypothetical protein